MAEKPLLVVAINIGLTSAGGAYSTFAEFNTEDPTTCHAFQFEGRNGPSIKVPTSILLDSEKKFIAFGYEAEDKYVSLIEDDKEEEVFFFQHFLLNANKYGSNSDFMVKALNRNTTVPVNILLQMTVLYLKDRFTVIGKFKQISLKVDEFFWVVTYPDELSSMFFSVVLDACEMAHIDQSKMLIVSESTASIAFCEQFKLNCFILDCSLKHFCPNVTYPKTLMSSLLEMSNIAEEFWNLIDTFCDSPLPNTFSFTDRNDAYRQLECVFMGINLNRSHRMIHLGVAYMSQLKTRVKSMEKTPFYLIADGLKMDTKVLLQVFSKSSLHLQKLLEKSLRLEKYYTIMNKKVFLVGDFSKFTLLREVLQVKFPHLEFIVPSCSDMSSLRGAVILGHQGKKTCTFIPNNSLIDTDFIDLEENKNTQETCQIKRDQNLRSETEKDANVPVKQFNEGPNSVMVTESTKAGVLDDTKQLNGGPNSVMVTESTKAGVLDDTKQLNEGPNSVMVTESTEADVLDDTKQLNGGPNSVMVTESTEADVLDYTDTITPTLPDPMRPGRIASMFQDIYEMEFVTGIQILCQKDFTEDNAMQLLFKILQYCYRRCKDQTLEQLKQISQVITPFSDDQYTFEKIPNDILIPMISYRKKNALKYMPSITKSIVNELPGKLDIAEDLVETCLPFIEKSIECCWFMAVIDPQMYLQFDSGIDSDIDENFFVCEGNPGESVKTVIWPILYLHENGPVMTKGVVSFQ